MKNQLCPIMILTFDTRPKNHEYFTTIMSAMKWTKCEVLAIKKKNCYATDDHIIYRQSALKVIRFNKKAYKVSGTKLRKLILPYTVAYILEII